jgi:hypothetical protein
MFIPLKMVSIGIDPYPFLFTGNSEMIFMAKTLVFPWN